MTKIILLSQWKVVLSLSLLNPGGKSPFAIDIFGVNDVDHYTLFPAGITT